MHYFNSSGLCRNCHAGINKQVFNYSIQSFGHPLCIPCQQTLRNKIQSTTEETLMLYFSLREREVPAELEKFDGYKTIDIAVLEAKVNIEVDGGHHLHNVDQALVDLQRTFYSFQKGFLTLRIPNILVKSNLDETADYVTQFLNTTFIHQRR